MKNVGLSKKVFFNILIIFLCFRTFSSPFNQIKKRVLEYEAAMAICLLSHDHCLTNKKQKKQHWKSIKASKPLIIDRILLTDLPIQFSKKTNLNNIAVNDNPSKNTDDFLANKLKDKPIIFSNRTYFIIKTKNEYLQDTIYTLHVIGPPGTCCTKIPEYLNRDFNIEIEIESIRNQKQYLKLKSDYLVPIYDINQSLSFFLEDLEKQKQIFLSVYEPKSFLKN